jgi:hypothetical protein
MIGVDDDLVQTIRRLRDLIGKIHRQKAPLQELEHHDTTFRNLLSYMRLHLTRLSRYPTMPLDYVALSTRNLIEVALWTEFIMTEQKIVRVRDQEAVYFTALLGSVTAPRTAGRSASSAQLGGV